jgi:hypothetical protein
VREKIVNIPWPGPSGVYEEEEEKSLQSGNFCRHFAVFGRFFKSLGKERNLHTEIENESFMHCSSSSA